MVAVKYALTAGWRAVSFCPFDESLRNTELTD